MKESVENVLKYCEMLDMYAIVLLYTNIISEKHI